MRIASVHIKGFGPFKDVSIDFDALPESAKLIALCGDNGEGKSTLVDLMVDGTAWREWPRRGANTKIDHVATARDSLLDVTHDIGGKRYNVRHIVDSVSGKGESAVYLDGQALTKSGKLSEFYAFAKDNFPAKSVVHSSIVSHPAYGSFVTMKATERKDVILLALGVDGIEKLAKSARDEADKSQAIVSGIRTELTKANESADVDAAEQYLHACGYALVEAEESVRAAQNQLDVARQLAGDSALARKRYEEQREARAELEERHRTAVVELQNTAERLEEADIDAAICNEQAAVRRLEEARTAYEEAEKLAQSLRVQRDSAQRQAEDRHRVQLELERAAATKTDVETRLNRIRAMLAKAPDVEAFVAAREAAKIELPRLLELEEAARNVLDAHTAELETISNERHAGEEVRIGALRHGLESIRDASDPSVAPAAAEETLDADDGAVEIATSFPARRRAAEAARDAARATLVNASMAVEECRCKATAVSKDEEALTTAKALLGEREEQLVKATADVERITEELEALPEPECIPADPDVPGLRKSTESAAARAIEAAAKLAATRATLEQLAPRVKLLRAEVADLQTKLDTTPVPVPPETAPDLSALETSLKAVQNEHVAAARAVGAAEAALVAAKSADAKAKALRVDLAAAELEVSDWTRLAADLGRKGLQATLVDSAAPELTRATNDLLHTCFGPRWTVTYETQRVNGNGSVSEGYDVRIIDTERGRDGVVEDLSDGERTIIGEAASLALTELACKRAGFENPTLIRDESGAALSPEKRPMWVAMLRRAARHVNADRVIVISHSEDVQEMCDVRMRVAGGQVTIEA